MEKTGFTGPALQLSAACPAAMEDLRRLKEDGRRRVSQAMGLWAAPSTRATPPLGCWAAGLLGCWAAGLLAPVDGWLAGWLGGWAASSSPVLACPPLPLEPPAPAPEPPAPARPPPAGRPPTAWARPPNASSTRARRPCPRTRRWTRPSTARRRPPPRCRTGSVSARGGWGAGGRRAGTARALLAGAAYAHYCQCPRSRVADWPASLRPPAAARQARRWTRPRRWWAWRATRAPTPPPAPSTRRAGPDERAPGSARAAAVDRRAPWQGCRLVRGSWTEQGVLGRWLAGVACLHRLTG
jgi:hypothetical protein